MLICFQALILLQLSAGWLGAAVADDPAGPAALPPECTEKVAIMPDLCQTDEAFRSLPHQGKFWCGPTAFANVILAMDQRGYDNLVDGDVTSKEQQGALLAQLGSEPYIRTDREGTGPIAAMTGMRRFVQERGYEIVLEHQGWRRGGEFASAKLVDLAWLRAGVLGNSNVVLNVGWYKHDKEKGIYQRIGGHYMTLVGYRQDGERFIYLIQDPAERSGPGKITHEARLTPIQDGQLAPWKEYGKRNAAGYCLVEGIVVKSTADVAILDGAVRFTISKRE